MINDVLNGFDPDNNLWDRVMFHDITGQMIIEGEFQEDSSDEEWAAAGQFGTGNNVVAET